MEQKKRQLEEIRNFYKPIEKRDIEEHVLRYERARQSKLEESRKAREASLQAEREHLNRLKELANAVDPELVKGEK